MNRKRTGILILLAAFLAAGCASSGKDKVQKQNGPGGSETVPEAETVLLSVQETESPEEAEPDRIGEDTHEIYQGFLNGTAGMKLVSKNEFFTSLDPSVSFEDGQEVSLREYAEGITAQIREEWYLEDEIRPVCEAAWIDCGGDGTEELALRLTFPTQIEEWTVYLVLHAGDGKLLESFAADAYARKGLLLNRYGYAETGGSNGATSHTDERFLIDAGGNPRFLVGINTEYDPMSFYYGGESFFLPEELYAGADAEILEYYFDWDYSTRNSWFVLNLPDQESPEDSIPEHPVRTELEKHQIELTTASEVRKMEEARRSDAGYQEGLAEAPEPEWGSVPIP